MRELLPPFGLDIFVNVTGVLGSILGFFSIFQIWGIVILGLTYAHLAKVSKGKAFFATSPSWLLGLLGAIIGGFFIK
jgi:hypothetical protein